VQLQSNLSLLMGKHRYNIQDVHEKTGLARRTVSALYNDKVTRVDFSTIEKLCKLFGCTLDDLFNFVDDQSAINGSKEVR
jgi:putative transcriptional regulator